MSAEPWVPPERPSWSSELIGEPLEENRAPTRAKRRPLPPAVKWFLVQFIAPPAGLFLLTWVVMIIFGFVDPVKGDDPALFATRLLVALALVLPFGLVGVVLGMIIKWIPDNIVVGFIWMCFMGAFLSVAAHIPDDYVLLVTSVNTIWVCGCDWAADRAKRAMGRAK
jgi:hypothetical protein